MGVARGGERGGGSSKCNFFTMDPNYKEKIFFFFFLEGGGGGEVVLGGGGAGWSK